MISTPEALDWASSHSIVADFAKLQARPRRDANSAAIGVAPHRIFGLDEPFRSFACGHGLSFVAAETWRRRPPRVKPGDLHS
jgi:hypothetical protein